MPLTESSLDGMLVGYTVLDDVISEPVSALAFKKGWSNGADWELGAQHLRSDDVDFGFPWPAPSNWDDLYPNLPIPPLFYYTGVAEVVSNGMLDVGVIANYAYSPDNAQYDGSEESDVVLTTVVYDSQFGAVFPEQSYIVSQIAEIPDPSGPDFFHSGGAIRRGSIDMALNVEAARFGEEPSETAITLYVIWESDGVAFPAVTPPLGEYDGWWLAGVTVGADGSIALAEEPRKLEIIPNQFGEEVSFASVAARTAPNGDQIVELAWAEVEVMDDPIPTCPSTATANVFWYHAVSTNGGAFTCVNQPCFSAPGGATKTRVDSSTNYRFCVGDSNDTSQSGPNIALPTPQLGFNDLGDMDYGRMHRFMAYPKRHASQNRMMIRVMRDHFALGQGSGYPYPLNGWQVMHDTSTAGDSFAPVMHISPGRVYDEGLFPLHALDEHGIVGVLFRYADPTNGAVNIRSIHSNASGDPLTWQNEKSSTDDWIVTTAFGDRQGLTAEERCMDADDCLAPPSDILWFGAWTDERESAGAQVWGGTYEN